MNPVKLARAALLFVTLVLLSACELAVDVDVKMEVDGTGTVTVVAVADAELVALVPELQDDLRLDDAEAQGWVVTGPVATEGGGAKVTLTNDFVSAQELANLLDSIGPPLAEVMVARTVGEDQTTNAIDATLSLPNGYQSFADADLVAVVGGVPFAEQFEASGLAPQDALSFTFRVDLPGELLRAETGTDIGNGVIEWEAPLDGTAVEVRAETVQQVEGSGAAWAGPVATISKWLLIIWCVLAVGFIGFVAFARRRKAQRREDALAALKQRG